VQQGSLGLAGAIDGAREFIVVLRVTSRSPTTRGRHSTTSTRRSMQACCRGMAFDFSDHKMLYAGDRTSPTALQINSITTTALRGRQLLENVRRTPKASARVLILGARTFRTSPGEIRPNCGALRLSGGRPLRVS